jgi:hypothetical protein
VFRAIKNDIAGWTPQLRDRKIEQLASVIAAMNTGQSPDLLVTGGWALSSDRGCEPIGPVDRRLDRRNRLTEGVNAPLCRILSRPYSMVP